MKPSIPRNPAGQEANRELRPAPRRRTAPRGFSMVELMAVVAISLIAMAIGVPVMLNVINASRVRNQMSGISGIVQMCRSKAVQMNGTKHLYFTTSGNETVAYVADPDTTAPALITTMPQVWMPQYFAKVAEPSTNPTPLDSTIMWGDGLGTAPDTTHDLCFNSRGIPCQCTTTSTAYCSGITNGYAFYFTLTSQPGGTRWAALGISPAGRIKTFFWDGNKWSD